MLELLFITSNRSKLDHARFLCRNYHLVISKQKQYGIGYVEPRIRNRTELLEKSIDDAISRLKKVSNTIDEKFVFIEDTSVIIEALSSSINEVPGVDVKYWMTDMNFEKLDILLKSEGNNRNVVVRSDIVLFLPKLLQRTLDVCYKRFTSQVKGSIIVKEIELATQPLYPWLSSQTFNKWFVPIGSESPMSLLDIDEALKVDFRKGAFDQMLKFLEDNGNIRAKRSYSLGYKQMSLFNQSLFVICGKTCAGKTTISEYLTEKYGIYHIEASDFMFLAYYEKHGPFSDVKIGDFAEDALRKNPSVVVDQIIKHLNVLRKGKILPIVISGFRSPEEIKRFKRQYNGKLEIEEVFIEASVETRFQRAVKRGRSTIREKSEFVHIDEQQSKMGLEIILKEIDNDSIIVNEASFEDYYKKFEHRFHDSLIYLTNIPTSDPSVSRKLIRSPSKLEHAILITLASNPEEYFTTTRIAQKMNNLFKNIPPKGKDNVSRYFNYKYYPYYELKVEEAKVKYRISKTGFSYAHIIAKSYDINLSF